MVMLYIILDFPGSSDHKVSAYSARDPGLILGQEDPLEKEMATHSSIPAWRIPWTGAWLTAGSTVLDIVTQQATLESY